ncbi:hypothetical protein BELL_0473g00020 [Botrytis elliptica]|uniref:Uncharacterized protein n=1 Tax=Botrytis elliptica TaxID=278938 RepID=A0A4Z1JG49_9HELO|nr:hypothetical protein BELL_0473g00020 [Botrytis elliptica]
MAGHPVRNLSTYKIPDVEFMHEHADTADGIVPRSPGRAGRGDNLVPSHLLVVMRSIFCKVPVDGSTQSTLVKQDFLGVEE